MAKTKQTPHCNAGLQQVTFSSDQPEARQLEGTTEEDILDMDNPECQAAQQAVGQGETSKSTGKAGECSQATDNPAPQGAEGGAEAPPATAHAPTRDPTNP